SSRKRLRRWARSSAPVPLRGFRRAAARGSKRNAAARVTRAPLRVHRIAALRRVGMASTWLRYSRAMTRSCFCHRPLARRLPVFVLLFAAFAPSALAQGAPSDAALEAAIDAAEAGRFDAARFPGIASHPAY